MGLTPPVWTMFKKTALFSRDGFPYDEGEKKKTYFSQIIFPKALTIKESLFSEYLNIMHNWDLNEVLEKCKDEDEEKSKVQVWNLICSFPKCKKKVITLFSQLIPYRVWYMLDILLNLTMNATLNDGWGAFTCSTYGLVNALWKGTISENTPARTISRLKNVSEQLRATQGFQLRQFTGIGLCALAQFSLFFVNIETNCLGCLCDQMFKVHHTLLVWQSRFEAWDQVWGTKSCLRPNLFNTVTCLRRRKLRFGRKMASS